MPLVGYLMHAENRPRLLRVQKSTDILVENLLLNNPPFWATKFHDVRRLEIRWVGINARRTAAHGHPLIDLTAFNTDGFDISGQHIWIHDCEIVR